MVKYDYKYYHKPSVVEAIQWDGINTDEVRVWLRDKVEPVTVAVCGSSDNPTYLSIRWPGWGILARVGEYILWGEEYLQVFPKSLFYEMYEAFEC